MHDNHVCHLTTNNKKYFMFFQVIRASGSVKISGNNLAGSIKLNDFSMSLKWSNIGNLRLYLIQVLLLYKSFLKLKFRSCINFKLNA